MEVAELKVADYQQALTRKLSDDLEIENSLSLTEKKPL
jgi:hypothetical protein